MGYCLLKQFHSEAEPTLGELHEFARQQGRVKLFIASSQTHMFGTFQFRDAIFSRFALTKWNPRCALEMSRRRLKEPQGCTCNMPVLTQRCPLSLKAEITKFAEVRQPFQKKYFHWPILFGFFIVLEFERTVCMYDPRLTKTTPRTNLLRVLGPRRCAMHGLAALVEVGNTSAGQVGNGTVLSHLLDTLAN